MTKQIKNFDSSVVFKGVSKSYQLGEITIPALKSVDITIPTKQFSMVIGPSGSGKTTLLNLIGCLDNATTGVVEICGESVGKLTDDEISEFRSNNISFIFQNFNLIPVLSAFENVEYPLVLQGIDPSVRKKRTMDVLANVGLVDHAHHRPNQLSGGQRQRVAIARALVKRPNLVLADEPTANLDSKTGAAIIQLMRNLQTEIGSTFIFSTHDPQLISHADQIFKIQDGTVKPEATKSQNGSAK